MVGRLYVEGGGDSKALHSKCREGFRKLLLRAGCRDRMPRIVACGGRQAAFETFARTIEGSEATLLVDAEGPMKVSNPWTHVAGRKGDGWVKPPEATADDLQLMVQLMESWLLADKETLETFFGAGFRPNALPGRTNIEEIPKQDVMRGLEASSRDSRKGAYHKGRHSFELLGSIDPEKLAEASPWARRFLEHMRNL